MAIPNNSDVQVANITPPAPAPQDLYLEDVEPDPLPVAQAPSSSPAAPAANPPSTPAAPTHPDILVQAAREVGIPDSVINRLPQEDLLAHTLDLQRKFAFLATNDARRQQQPQPQIERQKPQAEESDDEVLNHLEREVGYDPKLVGIIRKLRAGQEEIKAEAIGRRQRDQNEAARRQASSEEAVDDAMESLGPKFEKLIGKGPIRELKNQAHVEKRMAIYKHAGIDFQNDSERTIMRKISKAGLAIYGDLLEATPAPAPAANAYESPNGQVPNGKVAPEDWDRAGLARPTATLTKKSRSGKAAVEAIQDRMREMGVEPGHRDDEFDGLPD